MTQNKQTIKEKDFEPLTYAEFLFIGIGIIIVFAIGFLQGKYLQNETYCILAIILSLLYIMCKVEFKRRRLNNEK